MSGTVTSVPINCGMKASGSAGYNKSSFLLKLDESIAGIPEEVIVMYYSPIGFYIRVGDKIQLEGTIYQELLKYWQKDFIWINAEHIFNESIKCGF